MSAYSEDLRARIVRAVGNGMSNAEAARRDEIGLSTVKRYAQLGAGGSLTAKVRPGCPRAIGAAGAGTLRAQVAAHPDATVDEHRAIWARVRAGLPRKKSR